MSSAPSRIVPSLARGARGIISALLLAVLAASGAGLAGLAWHAPGTPARAELTFAGDAELNARLDVASEALRDIVADVELLATEAKTALEEAASLDPARLDASLVRGGALAADIDRRARSLRASLADLPGGEPDAPLRYRNTTLVRRAAILNAVEASVGLASNWQTVSARARDAGTLIERINEHDTTVLNAAQQGLDRAYRDAAATLDDALATMAVIETMRARLISDSGETVLDEWIARTKAYDVALQNVYLALVASKGKITVEVQSARREEQLARQNLPPDRRTILVILSEVTRGGLTTAVLAIEDAHARLDEALADVAALPADADALPPDAGADPAGGAAPS